MKTVGLFYLFGYVVRPCLNIELRMSESNANEQKQWPFSHLDQIRPKYGLCLTSSTGDENGPSGVFFQLVALSLRMFRIEQLSAIKSSLMTENARVGSVCMYLASRCFFM